MIFGEIRATAIAVREKKTLYLLFADEVLLLR